MVELSKEELLEIIAKQQEQLSIQDEKISGLERDFADLQEKYNKLLKEITFISITNSAFFYAKIAVENVPERFFF